MQRLTIQKNEIVCIEFGEKSFYIKPTLSGRLIIMTGDEYLTEEVNNVLNSYKLTREADE